MPAGPVVNWHFGKCPIDSFWHNKKYPGEFVDYIEGGAGWILSRKSMKIIRDTRLKKNHIYKNHIYEDIMLALLLRKNNIFPKRIPYIIESDIYNIDL